MEFETRRSDQESLTFGTGELVIVANVSAFGPCKQIARPEARMGLWDVALHRWPRQRRTSE